MVIHKDLDVVIIGGGPAGTTAASVLAEKGRRVAVLEKTKFPRYHVGESMIPYCYFPLKRIGMVEKLKASPFTKKYSVQFAAMDGRISQPFYFFQHFEHEASTTWQVRRDDFDLMMLDNAREKGTRVMENMAAKDFITEGGTTIGVRAVDAEGEEHQFFAPITIDASGRDGLAISKKKWRVRDQYLKKVAIWTYYKGALRDQGYDEGATTIAYLPDKGWFWYIPMADDMVSVGVVAEKEYLYDETRDPDVIFQREIKKNAWIETHLAQGTRCEDYKITADFSYRSQHCAADGLVLAGDAFAFLDPVFSSGLFLALMSGELAGETVHQALENQDFSANSFTAYGEHFCQGIEAMRKLVYAFYDEEFSFKSVVMKYPHLRSDLTDCLIGNVFMDFEPLFAAVREFAEIPEPLKHGGPMTQPIVAEASA